MNSYLNTVNKHILGDVFKGWFRSVCAFSGMDSKVFHLQRSTLEENNFYGWIFLNCQLKCAIPEINFSKLTEHGKVSVKTVLD